MRISDWSSDVCSSDLNAENAAEHRMIGVADLKCLSADNGAARIERRSEATTNQRTAPIAPGHHLVQYFQRFGEQEAPVLIDADTARRSEEHTSELQSLMRISYAVFCLKKKKNKHIKTQ